VVKNQPKLVQKSIQKASWARLCQNCELFFVFFKKAVLYYSGLDHFGSKIGPKLVEKQPKIEKILLSKPISNWIQFLMVFGSNFDQF
jgi:hypothetical protein